MLFLHLRDKYFLKINFKILKRFSKMKVFENLMMNKPAQFYVHGINECRHNKTAKIIDNVTQKKIKMVPLGIGYLTQRRVT